MNKKKKKFKIKWSDLWKIIKFLREHQELGAFLAELAKSYFDGRLDENEKARLKLKGLAVIERYFPWLLRN